MAKLLDTLMNRVIKGKLVTDAGDEISGVSHVKTSSNISELSDEILDALKVGDVVQKITGDMKHCYIVTYKEEHKGICLSYFDAGYLETISYDYTAGHWVFNSKDVSDVSSSNIYELPAEPTQEQIAEAMKHKFIKTTDSMVFVLFRSEVVEATSNIYHYYGCTYAYDDGVEQGGINILEMVNASGEYLIHKYENEFSDILNFGSVNEGKVMVVVNGGFVSPKDLFTAFTHSLAELDATLRGIIESSIADQEPKPCTQAQWNALKSVLDKSLYFNYEGVSMIKTITNGIDYYLFGSRDAGDYIGYSFFFQYEPVYENLLVKYTEL